jgi:hypothetical protein
VWFRGFLGFTCDLLLRSPSFRRTWRKVSDTQQHAVDRAAFASRSMLLGAQRSESGRSRKAVQSAFQLVLALPPSFSVSEKLTRYGSSALSGVEHLTLLVGKESVALTLIRPFGSLRSLVRASFQELRQFLPLRKAEAVVAALSLSVRPGIGLCWLTETCPALFGRTGTTERRVSTARDRRGATRWTAYPELPIRRMKRERMTKAEKAIIDKANAFHLGGGPIEERIFLCVNKELGSHRRTMSSHPPTTPFSPLNLGTQEVTTPSAE